MSLSMTVRVKLDANPIRFVRVSGLRKQPRTGQTFYITEFTPGAKKQHVRCKRVSNIMGRQRLFFLELV